jgi:tetratricopeptide (TPR) repeat protein
VLYGLLVAVGMFLVHNLVDFSLFEPGPMFLFALLTGAALGARLPENPPGDGVTAPRRRTVARVSLAVAVVAWLAFGGALVVPVALAETAAAAGDEAIRLDQPRRAVQQYKEAYATFRLNPDYAFDAYRAAILAKQSHRDALPLLDAAVAGNPASTDALLTRALGELSLPEPDLTRAWADFDAVLKLDPNNVPARLLYAESLEKWGMGAAAAREYEAALKYNAGLAPDEKKRLAPEKVEAITAKVKRLREEDAGATRPVPR